MGRQDRATDSTSQGHPLRVAMFVVAGWALLAFLGGAAGAPSVAAAACANEAIRVGQGAGVAALPDCMALEQVSPAKKGNQMAGSPTRIVADGSRLIFNSIATLGACPNVNGFTGDLFLAGRSPAGWGVDCVNLPYGSGSGPPQFSFTPDLSSWLQMTEESAGVFRFLRVGAGGSFTALSPTLEDPADPNNEPLTFQGAAADQSHVYFKPAGENPRNGYFVAGDPQPEGVGEDSNAYVSQLDGDGQPQLELLSRDRDGKVWGGKCGARLGGMESSFLGTNLNLKNGNRNQGAIAADGSYVYFSTRPAQPVADDCTEANKKRIMVREETPTGPLITELLASECDRVAPVCSNVDGDDAYQGGSIDQTKVYFTTTRQLADTDLDSGSDSCDVAGAMAGCDLYLYDATQQAGQRLTQVSAGEPSDPTPGAEARVYNSVAAISADGSRVYFVAQGVLTTDLSPNGATAVAGQPNLYAWSAETSDTAFIGTLVSSDGGAGSSGLWGSEGTWNNGAYPVPIAGQDGLGNEVGGDGHILLFKSSAPLSADDTDGGFRDVFRFDADSGELVRISKGGPGGSDNGPFNASPQFGGARAKPGTDYALIGRPISEDGQVIELTTSEGLLPGDPSGVEGVYLWKGGQVYRLPGSAQAKNTASNIPALSADGSTLAYHTTEQLLPSDGDSALDVYVARVGGGYALPVPPVPCQIDELLPGPHCPDPVQPPPPYPGHESWVDSGGNPQLAPPCQKGKVRKHGKCVKKSNKKHHKKRHHRPGKRTGKSQGGQK